MDLALSLEINNSYDYLRFGLFALFGVGSAFMVATNIIAYYVLRPPKMLGFLWWHVTAISLSFICLGILSLDDIMERIGQPPTWRLPVAIFGFGTFLIAQVLIFGVERSRFIQKKALQHNIELADSETDV